MSVNAVDALNRLREGNRRFVAGTGGYKQKSSRSRRHSLSAGQTPFAVVLGCSDSRVPPELAFDQGLGDLFVVRVAGNVAGSAEIGSIEYAVAHLGARLVVVLGHSHCGAVTAGLESLVRSPEPVSRNLDGIVGRIVRAIGPALKDCPVGDTEAIMRKAVRANVEASVRRLLRGSEVLASLRNREGLLVVGAACSIESGEVEFYTEDAVPEHPAVRS